MSVKYPHVKVELIGQDGNAFAILGAVKQQMKIHNISKAEIDSFMEEAMSGDYNHLLSTVLQTVKVSGF